MKNAIKIMTLALMATAIFGFVQPGKPEGKTKTKAGVYSTKAGNATFLSDAEEEDITAKSSKLIGVINPSNNKVAFSIDVKSFQFSNKLMEKHFNENYMETTKYPTATLTNAKINETVNYGKNGSYSVTVTGDLVMHGVTKNYTIPGTITINGNSCKVDCTMNVKLADHGISRPANVQKKLAEEVSITIDANLVKS